MVMTNPGVIGHYVLLVGPWVFWASGPAVGPGCCVCQWAARPGPAVLPVPSAPVGPSRLMLLGALP